MPLLMPAPSHAEEVGGSNPLSPTFLAAGMPT